eukprot:TRINITY_DN69537_c0_g1_i1.p1 TRINITY_DN69537_c0_g1~~TRINITY_DN69537_c0_g1_i1.p1  ORF type:complete len:567 (-),score=80.97 TRINITY_DN69537_c0_g1_i1:73-1773(-)
MFHVPLENRLCAYCMETVVVPVLLPCLHNVCFTCAEKIIETVNIDYDLHSRDAATGARVEDARVRKLRCPVCWQEAMFETKKGVASFPKNEELRQQIDHLLNPESPPLCDVCVENTAEYECETQCGSICGKCHTTLHAKGRFQTHRVISAEYGREPASLVCEEHEQPLTVYCYTDEANVCIHCASVGDHKHHHCTALTEAYSKELAELDELLQSCGEYCAQLRQGLQDIDGTLLRLNDEFDSARSKVVDHFNLLAIALDQRKQELLRQLEQLREHKQQQLQHQQLELDHMYDYMYTSMTYTQNALLKIRRQDVMRVRNHFKNRLKLIPRYPTPVSLAESPRFQYKLDLPTETGIIQKLGWIDFAPRVTGTVFPYKKDFDQNGVLHWIGCNYGTAPYRNPADLGLITVTASSCEYGTPANAIQHASSAEKHRTFMSQNLPGSWLEVHLGAQYVLCPSHYTLRNCTVNPCHSILSWEFQGSRNGHEWVTLRRHSEDFGLRPLNGSVCTWPIDDCVDSFNRFRVLMTGPNQYTQPHAQFHYLMLSGMEIYGVINRREDLEPGQVMLFDA